MSKVAIGFAAAVVLLLFMTVLSLWLGKHSEEAAAWQKHSFLVLDAADELLSTLKDAETGQRGYLASGNEEFLQPYLAVVDSFEPQLAELRRLTRDNPAQQHRLEALTTLIEARLALLQQSIALRREQHPEDALQILRSGRGKKLMDEIRVQMRDFTNMEDDLLQQREAAFNASQNQLLTVIGLVSGMVLLFALLSAALVYRETRQRLRATEQASQAAQTAHNVLRDSNTRIQTILNTVADGIVTINHQGIVTTLNPAAERLFGYAAAERLFGYAAAEVVGHNVNMLMPEPYRQQHNGYLEHYCTTGEARVIGIGREVTGQRKDGSTFDMYLAVNEMMLDGQRYFTGIVHDISARKQAEQAMVAAKEQAELANRAKDSFLATMSHEIRTPLTGMLGMLEVLSLTPLDHDQQETMQAAWDSARGLLRIVNDILDWSKIEAGKLHLEPQSTSIPRLLQEVVNTYSRVASAKSLVLKQHADCRLSAAHLVDGLRLSQILNNFVSNALKFTQSGEVVLSAELLEQLESGESVRFSVRDTGIGISKDAQRSLFQRYQQEGLDTARLYGGTGLGLAICRSLVEMMDGRIELESEPGRGSVFSITLILPVSGVPGESTAIDQSTIQQRAVTPLLDNVADAQLVLAVDDHPINRDLLARQIKLLGLRAETAEHGGMALLKWREKRYALVITDCHMPEMDGYAFTRAVRKIETEDRLARTPIIAWTANALAEEAEQCHAAGMDDVLVKPAQLMQLKQMLAKWLHLADSGPTVPPARDAESAPGDCPIDHAELGNVVADRAEQLQVLRDFQAHIRADRVKLAGMQEQGDLDAVARTAHRMKGLSGMVGATYLLKACADLEQAALAKDGDAARAAMTALETALRQLETYLAGLNVGGADERK